MTGCPCDLFPSYSTSCFINEETIASYSDEKALETLISCVILGYETWKVVNSKSKEKETGFDTVYFETTN